MAATKQRTEVSTSLAAQHRKLVLDVTPGLSGYRLAFVGGAAFEPVEGGLSLDQASDVLKAAKAARDDLFRIFNISKGAA